MQTDDENMSVLNSSFLNAEGILEFLSTIRIFMEVMPKSVRSTSMFSLMES